MSIFRQRSHLRPPQPLAELQQPHPHPVLRLTLLWLAAATIVLCAGLIATGGQ